MEIINKNTKYHCNNVITEFLLNTMQNHHQLTNSARLLNTSYGVSITINVLANFVLFISCAHYLTSLLVFFDSKNVITYYDYILCNTTWCVSAFSQIYIIITTWTSFSKEVSLEFMHCLIKHVCC